MPAINQNEISIYLGELNTKCIVGNVAKIKKSFPGLPIGFYDVFSDRITENGFCDDRLNDAVNYVIDNCVYPTPTIAQFISFDRKIKILNYNEYLKLCDDGIGNNYKPINFKDRETPVWIHVNDIKQFNIKSEPINE